LLPALRVGDIVDPGNGVFPPLQLLLSQLIHPPQEGVLGGLLTGKRPEIKEGGGE